MALLRICCQQSGDHALMALGQALRLSWAYHALSCGWRSRGIHIDVHVRDAWLTLYYYCKQPF